MKIHLHLLLLFIYLISAKVAGQSIRVSDGSPLNVQSKLYLTGAANQSGLRLSSLPYTSPATVLNRTKFLTVDEEGNVILGSLNNSARLAADSTGLWRSVGSYLQNSSSGGVIIGEGITYKPSGYNLYVSQGILTEKLKVAIKTTDDWSDKVFSSSYRLRPLYEVRQYIDQFHHLPGIDSADQIVKDGGIDVGRTEAKLLEKIEELTLYMLQQQKQIENLLQENQQIKDQLLQLKQKALR
ncbi:hypothetical protein GCM10028808_39470 [Spirosoma migulaei]